MSFLTSITYSLTPRTSNLVGFVAWGSKQRFTMASNKFYLERGRPQRLQCDQQLELEKHSNLGLTLKRAIFVALLTFQKHQKMTQKRHFGAKAL